jgi:hypothetical protein
MAKIWRYKLGMWKGADERKMVMVESFLRVLREGVVFLEWVWKVTCGWDQGGVAGWCGKEKTGFIGGVSVIGGRMGVVGTCDGMSVDLRVKEGW